MEIVKILIADDHQLIHSGIKDMLRTNKRYRITGHAYNGQEAIDQCLLHNPDVIFMDISMPVMNGIDATRIIQKKLPDIKIIALTQHEEYEYVMQFINAGGFGYLLKNASKEEFVNAIDSVLEDRKYFSQEVSAQMISALSKDKSDANQKEKNVLLTTREKEILQKIADDLSNQQIADDLNISLRTVETHRRNIMQKLKVNTVVALIKYATQHKLIRFD